MPLPCQTFWCLVMNLLLIPVQANPSGRWHVEWEKWIGGYHLVDRRDLQAREGAGADTCTLVDGKAQVVVAIASQHRVIFDLVGDLTGEHTPTVVLHTADGGAHGSDVYYVYALGKRPRCLLVYDKGNISGDSFAWDFHPVDLDGDGRKEILTWYDGLDQDMNLHGSIPLVLGYRNGRYVDVTASYPRKIRPELRKVQKELQDAFNSHGSPQELTYGQTILMAEWYATDLLVEKPARAGSKLLALIPSKYHLQIRERFSAIEHCLARRFRRYSYPIVAPHVPRNR